MRFVWQEGPRHPLASQRFATILESLKARVMRVCGGVPGLSVGQDGPWLKPLPPPPSWASLGEDPGKLGGRNGWDVPGRGRGGPWEHNSGASGGPLLACRVLEHHPTLPDSLWPLSSGELVIRVQKVRGAVRNFTPMYCALSQRTTDPRV